MRALGLTDTGKKRENNEDSILLNDRIQLYMVADGMGGHALGEVASQSAAKEIHDFVEKRVLNADEKLLSDDGYIAGLLKEAVTVANKAIYDHSRNLPGKHVIGTTVSVALIRNKKAYIAHVGDSRIYRLSKGVIEKLTKDHNKAQELVDASLLKEEEAENHPASHVLTRALGAADSVTPEIKVIDLKNDDRLFFSTDGLFRILALKEVKSILFSGMSIEEKCRILMDKALEGGAPDNVSFIILEPERKGILNRIFS